MKIIINAISVKENGGGVFQIATNFIIKSTEQYSKEIEWFYLVSEDLHKVFKKYSFSQKNNYFVFPNQPDFKRSYYKVRKELKIIEQKINPSVIYTIASPSYFSFDAPEVMRFTNPWVTNPNKFAYSTLNLKSKIRNNIYIINQKRLMRKRSYFITQSQTVKDGILSIVRTNADNVKVVSNVLPAVYLNNRKSDQIIEGYDHNNIIYIACVSAAHPHKNIDILPSVLKNLRDNHNITNVVILTTLPHKSNLYFQIQKELKQFNLEDKIINYDYCTQEQLIDLYSKCEICFMPTLLETFSATLIEAMFFNLAIVTTNFSFNSDVVGDSALFYDPMNAVDASEKLAMVIKDKSLRDLLKSKMPKYLSNYNSFDDYMNDTISFLIEVANKN